MNSEQVISFLTRESAFDLGVAADSELPRRRSADQPSTFRVLQSTECIHDCAYCPWRAGRDTVRATVDPEPLARSFLDRYSAGLASGLYLTSAVRESGRAAMEAMLQTATIVRERHGFEGPVHLKVMPGAERAQVQEAMRLADAISINLEVPNAEALGRVCGTKEYEADLLTPLGWIQQLGAEFPLSGGVSVQMMVGAAAESDREIIDRVSMLYLEHGVRRVRLAGFLPIPDTPLAGRPAASARRLRRLSQADLLLRQYRIGAGELAYGPAGDLALGVDPKMAQALQRPERFPIEVNTAAYEDLIRVPGVGPLSARRIIARRRERLIREGRELALCGAALKRAAPFVTVNGRALVSLDQYLRLELRRLQTRHAVQLPLFEEEDVRDGTQAAGREPWPEV